MIINSYYKQIELYLCENDFNIFKNDSGLNKKKKAKESDDFNLFLKSYYSCISCKMRYYIKLNVMREKQKKICLYRILISYVHYYYIIKMWVMDLEIDKLSNFLRTGLNRFGKYQKERINIK